MERVIEFPKPNAPEVAEFPRPSSSKKIINIGDWLTKRHPTHASDDNYPFCAA